MNLLELPLVVMRHLLQMMDPPSLLTLRLTCKVTKQFVEEKSVLKNIPVIVNSCEELEEQKKDVILWTNFRVVILRWGATETASLDKFLFRSPSFLTSLNCDCLTIAEIKRVLAIPTLEHLAVGGHHDCDRPLSKESLSEEEITLPRMKTLTVAGFPFLCNVLRRMPHLRILHIKDVHRCQKEEKGAALLSEELLEQTISYVKNRLNSKIKEKLTIEFGDSVLVSKEKLIQLLPLCHAQNYKLKNVSYTALPTREKDKSGGKIQMALNCIRSISIYLQPTMTPRLTPDHLDSCRCTISVSNMQTSMGKANLEEMQLPKDTITEMIITEISRFPEAQLIFDKALAFRPSLQKLSLSFVDSYMAQLLNFSNFPNLSQLTIGNFFALPKSFWGMCESLKSIKHLEVGLLTDKHITGDHQTPHPILLLTELKVLVLDNGDIGDSSLVVLSQMHLEKLVFHNLVHFYVNTTIYDSHTEIYSVTTDGVLDLVAGPIANTLQYLDIRLPIEYDGQIECKQLIKKACKRLKRLVA